MSRVWQPKGLPFEVNIPVGVWLNKSAPKGRQRRIGGLLTTDNEDRQGETVIQKGLDFSAFLNHGWFNDNHSEDTTGIVGYPEKDSLRLLKKGTLMPNGKIAPGNGHWAEGYLLENARGDDIWNTAQALAKAGGDRNLGFSVEGGIQKRLGRNNKTIARATVKNVAITNCPVNTDTMLETLAKSLQAVEACASPEDLWKALGMGTSNGPVTQPAGPQTGETAGQVLAPESLESGKKKEEEEEKEEAEEETQKSESSLSLTPELAWSIAQDRFPGINAKQVGRLVVATRRLKEQGAL